MDVSTYYDKDDILNLPNLTRRIREIDPSIILISICHSENLDLRIALEVEGIFAETRLKRDLILTTRGKQINLDPTQVDLLEQLAKDGNNHKTVVISGPEGSGKSLLAVEATKMKISSVLKQNPGKNRVTVRGVLCAAYQGDNRVPVLFQYLKEKVLNAFGKYCLIETKPLSDLPSNNVIDLQSKIQEELSKDPPVYIREDGVLMIDEFLPKVRENKTLTEEKTSTNSDVLQQVSTQSQKMTNKSESRNPKDSILPQQKEVQRDKLPTIVLLDEVLPEFGLHKWQHFQSDSNVEYVVAIRHTFSQRPFPIIRHVKTATVSPLGNALICVLDKRLRCSNEIIALTFYLMIHSKNNSELKSFEHSLDSFNGCVPIWLDVEDVEDFIYFTDTNPVFTKSVMVIYDPNDDEFSLQPVMKLCMDKKWSCQPYSSIVGSEASTVFLYNLKEFHFESFTRVTTYLTIITIKDKDRKTQ